MRSTRLLTDRLAALGLILQQAKISSAPRRLVGAIVLLAVEEAVAVLYWRRAIELQATSGDLIPIKISWQSSRRELSRLIRTHQFAVSSSPTRHVQAAFAAGPLLTLFLFRKNADGDNAWLILLLRGRLNRRRRSLRLRDLARHLCQQSHELHAGRVDHEQRQRKHRGSDEGCQAKLPWQPKR